MAFIEKFLGQRVEIPEDRSYHAKQGLWAKLEDKSIAFGLTEPALVLMGGLNDLDWLVNDGQRVDKNQAVVFAITGKILYLSSPFKGIVRFNQVVKENTSIVLADSYQKGWLFKLAPETEAEQALQSLASADGYMKNLKATEGFKNPDGVKGGVSGNCKAVYSGIREQKIGISR